MRNKRPKIHGSGNFGGFLGRVILCLFALIAQIAVPTIHLVGEYSNELPRPVVSTAWTHEDSDLGLVIEAATVSISRFNQHRHNPGSCLICREILLSQNFRVGSPPPYDAAPGPVDLVSFDHAHRIISSIFSFDGNPRSPPPSFA